MNDRTARVEEVTKSFVLRDRFGKITNARCGSLQYLVSHSLRITVGEKCLEGHSEAYDRLPNVV